MDPNALVRQVAGDLRKWSAENQYGSDQNFLKLEEHFQSLERSLVTNCLLMHRAALYLAVSSLTLGTLLITLVFPKIYG